MAGYCLSELDLMMFQSFLIREERSEATVQKYMRDVRGFYEFLGDDKIIEKERVMAYKAHLSEFYQISSANSMLAAVNGLLGWLNLDDCKVKSFKNQRQIFCAPNREMDRWDYERLIDAARDSGNRRLEMIIQTISGTGIRISELSSITLESVLQGSAMVYSKGKNRLVFLPEKVRGYLLEYCEEKQITSGMVFITRNGKPVDRSNVWKEMKKLSLLAGVEPEKVFPHNFRHLFAKTFYQAKKDIVYLADILGHSSVETTRIYTISSGREHRQMLDDMKLIV